MWSFDAVEGGLRCRGCGAEVPVVDGVPVFVGPREDTPSPERTAFLSLYLDSAAPDGAMAAFRARLATLDPVDSCVELGSGVGAVLPTLAERAQRVVGVDHSLAACLVAARRLRGEAVSYARTVLAGQTMEAVATAEPHGNVSVVCADVLDPPLVPGAYERVVSLHTLDVVASPATFLAVLGALAAPHAELVLATPYQWEAAGVPLDERFDEDGLRTRLRDAGWHLVDDVDLDWNLRRDARSALHYRSHWLRARR